MSGFLGWEQLLQGWALCWIQALTLPCLRRGRQQKPSEVLQCCGGAGQREGNVCSCLCCSGCSGANTEQGELPQLWNQSYSPWPANRACVGGRQIIQIAALSSLIRFLPFALFHPFSPDHLSAQDGESFSVHVHTETLAVLLMSAVHIHKVTASITSINFAFGAAFSVQLDQMTSRAPSHLNYPGLLSWVLPVGSPLLGWAVCSK